MTQAPRTNNRPDARTPPRHLTISRADAKADIDRLRADPKPLARPVVVIAGYRASGLLLRPIVQRIKSATVGEHHSKILPLAFPSNPPFPEIIRRTIDAVQARFPADDPERTAEVDVIGVSMGGIIARAAAAPPRPAEPPRKQLRINRLFTFASPHRGASLAGKIAIDDNARALRAGSGLLAHLDHHLDHAPYELVCYTRLDDWMVGATNTAPPGREPIWVDNPTPGMSHFLITADPRLLADLLRRLRDEEPLATHPDQPPPRD